MRFSISIPNEAGATWWDERVLRRIEAEEEMNHSAAVGMGSPGNTSSSKPASARHFVEMVLLMLAGMGVLSGLATLLFSAAGSSLSDPSGGFRVAPWV